MTANGLVGGNDKDDFREYDKLVELSVPLCLPRKRSLCDRESTQHWTDLISYTRASMLMQDPSSSMKNSCAE